MVPLIKVAKLRNGHCVAGHYGDVAVMVYQDKMTVYTLSTHHGTEYIPVETKPGRPAHYKPSFIYDYNKMGGLDKKEQMLKPYLVENLE